MQGVSSAGVEVGGVGFAESGTRFGTRIVRGEAQDHRVPVPTPRLVRWTDHAVVKAELLGYSRADIEDAILEGHEGRTRNTGAADWLLTVGRLEVAYNHPDGDDDLAALVVTLWRRA